MWANAVGKDYDEKQIKRIANAKKRKARTSTKKHDRRMLNNLKM